MWFWVWFWVSFLPGFLRRPVPSRVADQASDSTQGATADAVRVRRTEDRFPVRRRGFGGHKRAGPAPGDGGRTHDRTEFRPLDHPAETGLVVAHLRNHHVCSPSSNLTQNLTHAKPTATENFFDDPKEISSDPRPKRAHYHHDPNLETNPRRPRRHRHDRRTARRHRPPRATTRRRTPYYVAQQLRAI